MKDPREIDEKIVTEISLKCQRRVQKMMLRSILAEVQAAELRYNSHVTIEQSSRIYSYVVATLSANVISAFLKRSNSEPLVRGMYDGITQTITKMTNDFIKAHFHLEKERQN